jgi:hypothetical protein
VLSLLGIEALAWQMAEKRGGAVERHFFDFAEEEIIVFLNFLIFFL